MHLNFTYDLIKKAPNFGAFFYILLLELFENILFRSERLSEAIESLGIVYFQIYLIDRNSSGLCYHTSCSNRFARAHKI